MRLLVTEQAKRGMEATVLTSSISSAPSVSRMSEGPILYRLPSFELGNDAIIPRLLTTCRRLSEAIDLIHLHGHLFYSTTIGAIARTLWPLPTILTFHGDFKKETRIGDYGKRVRNVVQGHYILKRMDGIIALTKHDAGYLVSRGANGQKITVVPNGIPIWLYHTSPPKNSIEDFKASMGLEQESSLILFVGRLVDQKGLVHLLKAVPKLLTEDPTTRLLVVGGGPLLEPSVEICKNLDIEESVKFMGVIPFEDLVMAYHSCDVVVAPSLWEGMPLVLLEAAACGKPVVASDIAGISEFVDNNSTGLLVPPSQHDALAEGISTVVGDSNLARKMSSNAKSKANDHFSIDTQVDRTIGVYESVLQDFR